MKRTILTIAAASLLLAGCQSGAKEQKVQMLQQPASQEQLLQSFSQLAPPSMSADIMNGSDSQIISWVSHIDRWTYNLLAAPITGTMDEASAKEMRNRLEQVYTDEMAERLVSSFYRYDPVTRLYYDRTEDAAINYQLAWNNCELSLVRPSPDIFTVTITSVDQATTAPMHRSMYQLIGNRLQITEFETRA